MKSNKYLFTHQNLRWTEQVLVIINYSTAYENTFVGAYDPTIWFYHFNPNPYDPKIGSQQQSLMSFEILEPELLGHGFDVHILFHFVEC